MLFQISEQYTFRQIPWPMCDKEFYVFKKIAFIKGIVHPKMTILLLFTNPQVVINP